MATTDLELQGYCIFDDVVADPWSYRAWVLQQAFGDVQIGDQTFKGIAPCRDDTVAMAILEKLPLGPPHLSFFRQSPEGQDEPNYIHSDREMGDWTGILYLTTDPADGDGTRFWQQRSTGKTGGAFDAEAAKDLDDWECWAEVPAVFNRLLVFRSDLFHSRALRDNYGHGAQARLIQVLFGSAA